MGRRGRFAPINRHIDGSRASIGDWHVDEAVGVITRAALIEMNLCVTETFNRERLIPMCFPDEVVEKLQAVQGMVDPSSPISTYEFTSGIHLAINFKDALIPTPVDGAWAIHHSDRARPFLAAVHELTQIREKYAAVYWLLRWFNRNATPAAVRAMWPAVLSLCPKSSLCQEYADMPSRYIAPNDSGRLANLIRDTAGTVAAMQLIPADAEPRTRGTAWLTFSSGLFMREGVEVMSDPLSVSL